MEDRTEQNTGPTNGAFQAEISLCQWFPFAEPGPQRNAKDEQLSHVTTYPGS